MDMDIYAPTYDPSLIAPLRFALTPVIMASQHMIAAFNFDDPDASNCEKVAHVINHLALAILNLCFPWICYYVEKAIARHFFEVSDVYLNKHITLQDNEDNPDQFSFKVTNFYDKDTDVFINLRVDAMIFRWQVCRFSLDLKVDKNSNFEEVTSRCADIMSAISELQAEVTTKLDPLKNYSIIEDEVLPQFQAYIKRSVEYLFVEKIQYIIEELDIQILADFLNPKIEKYIQNAFPPAKGVPSWENYLESSENLREFIQREAITVINKLLWNHHQLSSFRAQDEERYQELLENEKVAIANSADTNRYGKLQYFADDWNKKLHAHFQNVRSRAKPSFSPPQQRAFAAPSLVSSEPPPKLIQSLEKREAVSSAKIALEADIEAHLMTTLNSLRIELQDKVEKLLSDPTHLETIKDIQRGYHITASSYSHSSLEESIQNHLEQLLHQELKASANAIAEKLNKILDEHLVGSEHLLDGIEITAANHTPKQLITHIFQTVLNKAKEKIQQVQKEVLSAEAQKFDEAAKASSLQMSETQAIQVFKRAVKAAIPLVRASLKSCSDNLAQVNERLQNESLSGTDRLTLEAQAKIAQRKQAKLQKDLKTLSDTNWSLSTPQETLRAAYKAMQTVLKDKADHSALYNEFCSACDALGLR